MSRRHPSRSARSAPNRRRRGRREGGRSRGWGAWVPPRLGDRGNGRESAVTGVSAGEERLARSTTGRTAGVNDTGQRPGRMELRAVGVPVNPRVVIARRVRVWWSGGFGQRTDRQAGRRREEERREWPEFPSHEVSGRATRYAS